MTTLQEPSFPASSDVLPELLYLSRAEVADLLPPIMTQLDLVASIYRAHAAGRIEQPPKPGLHPREEAFIHAMPAYLVDEDVPALKWIAGYRRNKHRGLPYLSGLIVVNDPDTGFPLAVMDASEITAARTAGASGVCIRRFAPKGWRRAALLGCGEQARYHTRVLAACNPDVEIAAYDPHLERIHSLPAGRVIVCASPREAVNGAEIVISAGPMRTPPEPSIDLTWLGERWLALPLDADAYFQAGVIEAADLFVTDDIEQFEHFRRLGQFDGWPAPGQTVGAALRRGAVPKRIAASNLGMGALDAAYAKQVLDAARGRGVGTLLPR